MSKYTSEPYEKLLAAHTHLNNYVKISTAALTFLYNSKSASSELAELINELIISSGERWTMKKIINPKAELIELKLDLSKSAIIWVYSAFDVYFQSIGGVLSEILHGEDRQILDKNQDHKIAKLYDKLDWDKSELASVLPVLEFYETIRHVVAHNWGKPNKTLIEISQSQTFKSSVLNWKTKYRNRTIDPPPLIDDEEIVLRPHHAIMYSETCLRIARDIDCKIYETSTMSYFVNKIIEEHLTKVSQLTKPVCDSLRSYIAYHLEKDFYITERNRDKLLGHIDSKHLKALKKRYQTFKDLK